MYKVLDSYRPFDQKNNMVHRPFWDPSLRHLAPARGETQLRHMERKTPGFELRDFALAASAHLVVSSFGTEVNLPNSGLKSWTEIPVSTAFKFPEKRPKVINAGAITKDIKRVARYFGASLVGVARLDRRWIYSHHYFPETGESKPVEIGETYQNVIVMAIGKGYKMIRTAPTAQYHAEAMLTYSRMAMLVGSLAQFIRLLGYHAIPSLNDTGLNIPLAIDAGLGQFGRNGLLISPHFGPRQRICKVITELPLEPDAPIDFGVAEFCSVCRKCATKCPANAISFEGLTAESSSISINPGVMKWPVAGEKCWEFRLKNFGTICGICMRVCPFNKNESWLHDGPRWLVKHLPWVDRGLVWLDDFLGYGRYVSSNFFHNDENERKG